MADEDNLFDHNRAQDRLARRLALRSVAMRQEKRPYSKTFTSISDMLTDIRDKHAAPGDYDDAYSDGDW